MRTGCTSCLSFFKNQPCWRQIVRRHVSLPYLTALLWHHGKYCWMMEHVQSSQDLPWCATIYCTMHIHFGSSSRPKHAPTILYEVGWMCSGTSLNPLTRGLHQLSYPQREAYACSFFFLWSCSVKATSGAAVNSTAICLAICCWRVCLECVLFFIFSDALIVIWPLFHLVARKIVEHPSRCENKMWIILWFILLFFFFISSVVAPEGPESSWKRKWKVVCFFFK